MNKFLETPCGKFPRRENFDDLTDIELIEQLIERAENCHGFVCPETVQEMKDRGLTETYMTMSRLKESLIIRKQK